jgi:hypothetical protein
MTQMRKIAAATILCLVLSLALFTTGAFAKSANTSVAANTATAAQFFGGPFGFGPFIGGGFGVSVTTFFNFSTFVPFGFGGCGFIC